MDQGVQMMRTTTIDSVSERASPSDVSIAYYENMVPSFAAAETDRLYAHLHCSFSYFMLARKLDDASTYIARKEGVPTAILLFRRERGEITVISEFIKLDQEEMQRFARYVFTAFHGVNVISFDAVYAARFQLPYPVHAATFSEDMVVELPASVDDYEVSVGKNMRRNVKRYTSALKQAHPSCDYRIHAKEEITEQDIRDIIRLGCARMAGKNIVPRYDEEETQWIADFSKTCGMVGTITIEGRIVAGAIAFRIGHNYFMHVIAHDPDYDSYSPGIVCYFLTICEGIRRGGKRFHLLQGRYGYKHRLLAEKHDIVHVDIYRNYFWALMHARRIARKAFNGAVREVKQWLLHDVERRSDAPSRFIGKLVNSLRAAKRGRKPTN